MKPRLTDKVKRGLWLIVARSGTLWAAQEGASNLEPEDEAAVLAAGRYAEAHWGSARQKEADGLAATLIESN